MPLYREHAKRRHVYFETGRTWTEMEVGGELGASVLCRQIKNHRGSLDPFYWESYIIDKSSLMRLVPPHFKLHKAEADPRGCRRDLVDRDMGHASVLHSCCMRSLLHCSRYGLTLCSSTPSPFRCPSGRLHLLHNPLNPRICRNHPIVKQTLD